MFDKLNHLLLTIVTAKIRWCVIRIEKLIHWYKNVRLLVHELIKVVRSLVIVSITFPNNKVNKFLRAAPHKAICNRDEFFIGVDATGINLITR